MKTTLPLLLLLFAIGIISCKVPTSTPVVGKYLNQMSFSPGQEKEIRTAFITIKDSTVIHFERGTYHFEKLSIQGKLENILLKGEGADKTIFDFSTQDGGGEGMRVDDLFGFEMTGIQLKESKGDLLKINKCKDVTLTDVHTVWEGEPDVNNGGYGIYPVLCENVIIDNCYTRGASDAGIYVGQTIDAVIKNSKAEYCVAGIEIENTQNAIAFNNEATNNTGGFFVFDHPDLKHDGKNIKVYNNNIHHNNYRNFAPAANSATGVGNVPPGTGLMIMRTSDVEAYNNTIKNNNTMSIGILSYISADPNIVKNRPDFDPIPKNVYVHDNDISKEAAFPEAVKEHDLAQLIVQLYQKMEATGMATGGVHEILYDGVELGGGENPNNICIKEKEGVRFLNMDVANGFASPNTNVEPYLCPSNEQANASK